MTEKISKKTVFIIDGSSFLYRAYYGLKPLHTSQGMTVHAVYGFCRMIKKLIDKFSINHVVVVWDSKGKTARHEIFSDYKATRQDPPSDIFLQKDLIQELLQLINIAQLSVVGQEADDLMYSFAQKVHKVGYDSVIVSSDKDMRQILCDYIKIYDPFFDTMITHVSAQERYGFDISKIPFYFALLGDSSDNIPGVKGVGEKTATQIVKQFSDLHDMYNNLQNIEKDRTRLLLEASRKEAFLSYDLFLLRLVNVDLSVQDTEFKEQQWSKALPLLEKLEFKSFVKEITTKYTSFSLAADHKASLDKKLHDKYNFICLTDQQILIDLCQELEKAEAFAIDTETNGFDPMQAQLVGISISYVKGQAFYIPLAHQEGFQLPKDVVLRYLGPIFAHHGIAKYMHNAKYDLLILSQAGFKVNGHIFDTMIAASLVTKEWEKIGLKDLSDNILGEKMLSFKEVVSVYGVSSFDQVPLVAATAYAAADAHQTLQLAFILKKEIENQSMQDLLYGIELPVNDVLVAMQHEGIYCDSEVLLHLSKQVEQDLLTIEQKIQVHAGQEINLNSPKQIRTLLFDILQLVPQKKSGKTQQLSTDAEVLKILAREHEVPLLLLAYRELYKLKSTYIDSLPQFINPQTGRIHTSWNQTVVATGRVSSSNPNLQNIPRDGLEYGKQYDVDVRSAFKAKQGWTFISADYSQIELRILAQLSGDQTLKQAFLDGLDIHAQTAAQLFDVDLALVTSEQRAVGKRLNFSILYGLTAYGLSRDLMIPYAQAKLYIQRYFEKYPGVQKWMEDVVEAVKKNGYTITLYGRRRYLPGIYEKNKTLFDIARRIAINTPAQGTAAEITKMGMIKMYQLLAERKLQGKILLQIHDELLITCPDSEAEVTAQLLQHSLTSVVSWSIPLEVAIRIGKNWQDVSK